MGKKIYKPKLFLCPHCDRATFGTTNAHICESCYIDIMVKFKMSGEAIRPELMDEVEMLDYHWREL